MHHYYLSENFRLSIRKKTSLFYDQSPSRSSSNFVQCPRGPPRSSRAQICAREGFLNSANRLRLLLDGVPISGGSVQDLRVDKGHLLSAAHALIQHTAADYGSWRQVRHRQVPLQRMIVADMPLE